MRKLYILIGLGGTCVAMAGCEPRLDVPAARGQPIVGGTTCREHPEVGLLRVGAAACSATLVGPRTALTAAHCLAAAGQASLTLEGTAYRVAQALQHPDWDARTLANDIAVLRLAESPPVPPAALSWQAPARGMHLRLVGLGISGEGATDPLVKRIAENQVADLEPTRFTVAGSGDGLGNICRGDSGGPALAALEETEPLVGVSSAGIPPCGTLGYFTRVDAYRGWLTESAGEELKQIAPSDETGAPSAGGAGGHASDGEAMAVGRSGGCGLAATPGEGPGAGALLVLLLLLRRPRSRCRRQQDCAPIRFKPQVRVEAAVIADDPQGRSQGRQNRRIYRGGVSSSCPAPPLRPG